MSKCVIVGAGECSPQQIKESFELNGNDICIAADGGLDYLLEVGICPGLVIGDMDSLKATALLEKYKVKVFPTEKDDTDMLLAIKEGLELGCDEFEIYGALGGAFDHSFANLQCLNYIVNKGAKASLIDKKGNIITMIKDEDITLKASEYKAGRRISIFSFGKEANGVTIKGLKYTANDITMKSDFPIGVSNEFTGDDAYVNVKDGILMICIN